MKYILRILSVMIMFSLFVIHPTAGVEKVDVSFFKNDGDQTFEMKTYMLDQENKFDVSFQKEGYVLMGWSTNSKAKEIEYETNYAVTNDWIKNQADKLTLYAVWQPVEEKKGNIIAIGDSYFATTDWGNKLSQKIEMPIIKSDKGGTGFVNSPDDENFKSLFEKSMEYIHENDVVDYVIVIGGYNDWSYSKEDIEGEISLFCDNVKNKYPEAKILIGMAGWNTKDEETQKRLIETATYYEESANANGAIYLKVDDKHLYEIVRDTYSGNFMEDGFHPQYEVGEFIADVIQNNMNFKEQPKETEKEVVLEEPLTSEETIQSKPEETIVEEKQAVLIETETDKTKTEEVVIEEIINEPEKVVEKPTKSTKKNIISGLYWSVTLLDENGNYVGTKIVEDGGTIQDMPEGYRQADFTNVHGSKTIYAIPEEQRNAKRFSPPNTSDTSIVMWGSIFEIALLSIMINGYILKKYARN